MRLIKFKKKSPGKLPIDWTDEEIDAWAEHKKRMEAREDRIAGMIIHATDEKMKALRKISQ